MTQKKNWGENLDKEVIEKLIELRSYLENRMKQLEDESEKLRILFKIVDEVIVSKSFRKAETLPVSEHIESIPLKTFQGILLAEMLVSLSQIRIVPNEAFDINTSPFQSFFVSRILESMKVKDIQEVQKGKRLPDKAFSYDIVTQEDIIKEVLIKNYRDDRRLQKIKTSCRWTLEKMYEKMQKK